MKTDIEEVKFSREFINLIDDNIKLTPYQKEKLSMLCDNFYPYYIFKKKDRIKTTFLWRLTIPFYIIYCLLAFLISPIKWIITGSGTENHRSIIYKIYRKWSEKINIYL